MSNARIFFAGVGTTILLIGAGFSGGLMLAKTAMEPVPLRATIAEKLPARVVLPPSTEPVAAPPAPATPPAEEAAVPTPPPVIAQEQRPEPQPVPVSAPLLTEKDKQAERAERRRAEAEERRKAEAAEREHRRRIAERKAKREAVRLAKQQQLDQRPQDARSQDRPGIMAFGSDENQTRLGGFFGN